MNHHEFQLSTPNDDALRTFGASDFAKLVRAHNANQKVLFVDKTPMIEALLSHKESVTLFTRPRRFGKSTNISMLHYFLGVPQAASLFAPLKIGKNKQIMEAHQGKHAVISLTLKNLNAES